MIEVIPTVVPNALDDVSALLTRCREFTRVFHVDAADGTLTHNATWIPVAGQTLPEAGDFLYEAHLMLVNPEAVGHAFIAAGAKRIITQVESFDSEEEANKTFASWRAAGVMEIGLALLIGTPLEALDPYLLASDSVTLMSIDSIGVQGIPFDERAYGRVSDLHRRYPDLSIEVDGGVGETQISALARAGATRFSVGSAMARSEDPAKTHKTLLDLASAAV